MNTQPRIVDLLENDRFDGYLMVKSAAVKQDKNGRDYLTMTLGDISGEIDAKVWNFDMDTPKPGDVLSIRGTYIEYNGRPQLKVNLLSPAEPDYDCMELLVPCAPLSPEVMLDYIWSVVTDFNNADLNNLVSTRLEECKDKLPYYPAAKNLHHAERSGLLHHMYDMLRTAEGICRVYTYLDRDLLNAGIILHDLCKIEEMDADEFGNVSGYTATGNLLGHLVKGVMELDRIGRETKVDPELLMVLEHMILAHHDRPEYGSPKPPMFPEAEVLHTLDMMDARLYEMKRALDSIKPGQFTDRMWSMDERRLYKRSEN